MRNIVRAIAVCSALGFALSASATADDDTPDRAEDVGPIAVGSTVPSAEIRTVQGEPADLAGLVRDAGALLVFYRGGW